MNTEPRKIGYNYPLKWIIGLVNLIIINLSLILLYHILPYWGLSNIKILVENIRLVFLLINLIYFFTIRIIEVDILSNIIFLDKIIQKSLSFISLYFILLSVSFVLCKISIFGWSDWLSYWISLNFTYVLWHVIVRSLIKLYRSKGYNAKRVVIIGNGKHASAIYHEIKSGDYGYKILGAFSDSQTPRHSPLHHLGSIVDVNKFCIENSVDEIYCTLPRDSESDIIQLINFAEKNMIRFFLVPEFYEYIRRNPVISLLQSIPVIAIRPEPLQLVHNRVIKRIFDILFSTVILLTIFPVVFIIFGFFIKITSRGSIFFTQNRTGLQGKTFKCYKFRSMTLNEESDEKIASRSDARITLVGAFMRRTSIDELPQFFNVLIGNMSVVGPRPHMLKQTYLYAKLIDKFMIRHIIKPGITGWAQMSGYRGETKTIEQMEGRLKRDVWYIENWSFILDLKIIAVTIFQILKGDKKAY